MSRKLPFLASLAAGCMLSTGAAFAGNSFAPPPSGQMTLWVNTITGDALFVGNNVEFGGYGVTTTADGTSTGNQFLVANYQEPLTKYDAAGGWGVLTSTSSYVAEGNLSSFSTAGSTPPYVILNSSNASASPFPNVYDLGDIYDTSANNQDLVLNWLNSNDASVPGWTPPSIDGIDTGTVGPQGVQYATPEPATLGLLSLGGLGLLVRRRHKSLA